jgi:hypothetical protein
MVNPASGPLLFDTSAESWLARTGRTEVLSWMREYLSHHQVHISAVTVKERVRGYSLLWRRAEGGRRQHIEAMRIAYLTTLGRVWPLDGAVAVVAGEIMALLPDSTDTPPTVSSSRRIPPRASGEVAIRRDDCCYRARREDAACAQQRCRL